MVVETDVQTAGKVYVSTIGGIGAKRKNVLWMPRSGCVAHTLFLSMLLLCSSSALETLLV